MLKLNELKVKVIFDEEVLGSSPADPEILQAYIAEKSGNPNLASEEVETIQNQEIDPDKGLTVFPKENGVPFAYDYQWRGFLKDAIGMLRNIKGSKSSKLTAYKKKIDGLIFVKDRKNFYENYEPIGRCERPLRASTPQGERVALAASETIPAGAFLVITFLYPSKEYRDIILECLDYGTLRGFSQWRNSGKGKFHYEILDEVIVKEK